jgi:hypothetical protein
MQAQPSPAAAHPNQKNALIIDMLNIFTAPYSVANPLEQRHEFLRPVMPLFNKATLAKAAADVQVSPGLSSIPHILRHVIAQIPLYNAAFYAKFLKHFPCNIPRSLLPIPVMAYLYWMGQFDFAPIVECFEQVITLIRLIEPLNRPLYHFCLSSLLDRYIANGRSLPMSIIADLFAKIEPGLFKVAVRVVIDLFATINMEGGERVEVVRVFKMLVERMTTGIRENPAGFSAFSFKKLSPILFHFLNNLDSKGLELVHVIAGLQADSTLLQIIAGVPQLLVSRAQTADVFSHRLPRVPDSAIARLDLAVRPLLISNDQAVVLPDDLTAPAISEFSSQKQLEDFMTPELIGSLTMFREFFDETVQPEYRDRFCEGFVKLLADLADKNQYITALLSFLYMLLHLKNLAITDQISDAISGKPIFAPGISVFDRDNDFEIVAVLRKTVLMIYQTHSPTSMFRILENLEFHPFLFADVVGRIHHQLGASTFSKNVEEATLVAIVRIGLYLTTICGHSDPVVVQKALEARATVYWFLLLILETPIVARRGFSSPAFVNGFLDRFLDPALHKPILNAIRQYLRTFEGDDLAALDPVITFVRGFIDTGHQMSNQQVILDLLCCINESIIEKPLLPRAFTKVIRSATTFVISNPRTTFLDQTLQLYSQLLFSVHDKALSMTDVQNISKAIRLTDGPQPSDATFGSLVGMLSGSRTINISTMFLIRQPLILVLLLSITQHREATRKFLGFFLQLCSHSALNCVKCHKAQLDMLLLTIIQGFPEPVEFHGCTFDVKLTETDVRQWVLPLIGAIATFACTPQVITKMISITSPSKEHIFPRFATDIMGLLSSTMSRLCQQCSVVLPVGYPDRIISVEGVTTANLENGFTFEFSLLLDSHVSLVSTRKPCLLSISDGRWNHLLVYIQGASIITRMKSSKGTYFAPLNRSGLLSCCWCKLTFAFTPTEVGNSASLVINDSAPITYSLGPLPFSEGPLAVTLGGLVDANPELEKENETICQLGPFRFFDQAYQEEQLASFPRQQLSGTPLFAWPAPSQLSVTLPAKTAKVRPTIVDALSQKQIVKSLLPFFLYMTDMPSHFPQLLIDLLHCLVQTCVEAKKHTYYFPVIAYMLLRSPPEKSTYNLYLKFFGLLENSTATAVTASLVLHILFNFDLWIAVPDPHLSRIVGHWTQALFVACPQLIGQSFELPDLLAMIRIFFWYEPIEQDLIRPGPGSNRARPEDLDIEGCRQHLNRLLVALCLQEFTEGNARTLLSHIIGCKDKRQTIALLKVFVDVMRERKVDSILTPRDCRALYSLFESDSEEQFMLAIEILCRISGSTFTEYLHDIMFIMNSSHFTQDFYDKCLELLTVLPAIYPICCLLALNVGRVDLTILAQRLYSLEISTETAETILADMLWPLWPILILLNLPETRHSFIFQFVCNIMFYDPALSQLDSILAIFDLLALHLDHTVEQISRHFFLRVIFDQFVEKGTCENQMSIVIRCLNSLLLHIHSTPTRGLMIEFANSPWACEYEIESIESPEIRTIPDILSVLCEPSSHRTYHFGLEVDREGHPQYVQLFETTVAFLDHIQAGNEIISLWKQQFHGFAHHRAGSDQCLVLNTLAPLFSEKVICAQVQQLKIIREILTARYRPAVCDPAQEVYEKELIELSLTDITGIRTSMDNTIHRNSRRLKHLIKENMHKSSPWSDEEYQTTKYRKLFLFGPVHTQPLMKRCLESSSKSRGTPPISGKSWPCVLVKVSHDVRAVFWRDNNMIYITKSSGAIAIPTSDIKNVLIRTRFCQPTGIEIFVRRGRGSFLIDFAPQVAHDIITNLKTGTVTHPPIDLPLGSFGSTSYTQRWADGELSNFRYLMLVNEYAGRSYHDIAAYPIFPCVLSDFSRVYQDRSQLRNFMCPIARAASQFVEGPSFPGLVLSLLCRITPFSTFKTEHEFKSMADIHEWATLNSKNCELTPEFFFSPQCVAGDFELPEWCKDNPDLFIYYHRKILESDEVSTELCHWIDLIFGVASRGKLAAHRNNAIDPCLCSPCGRGQAEIEAHARECGQLPNQLFTQPHLRRRVLTRAPASQRPLFLTLHTSFAYAAVIDVQPNAVTALCLDSEDFVFHIKTDFASQQITRVVKLPSSKKVFTEVRKGFAAIERKSCTAHFIQEKNYRSKQLNMASVKYAASDRESVLISSSNGQIVGVNMRPVCSINVDYVSALALDKKIGIVVVGTQNGSVIVSMLGNGSFVWSGDVKSTPIRIIITKNWGFVFVETSSSLWLFSVNGRLLKKVDVEFRIEHLITWKCERGFDYIAFAENSSAIHMFEAYLMNIDNVVLPVPSKVLAMKYSVAMRTLIVITENGEMLSIPKQLP